MKTEDIPTFWGKFWWVYEGVRLGGGGNIVALYAALHNAIALTFRKKS
jgi:hypothetical protein